MSDALAPLGHNRTLADRFAELNAEIPKYLAQEHESLNIRADEFIAQFAGLPHICDTDELEREMTDLGARLNKFLSSVDAQRKSDKRAPGESPKLIDDFFKQLAGTLPARLDNLRSWVNTYKNTKIEAERQRLAAERERALAAQREADEKAREAERVRREAEDARLREEAAAAADNRAPEPTPEELLAQEAERAAIKSQAEALLARPTAAATAPMITAPMIKAESGAKSGQIGKWVARDIDRDTLDLNALRSLIPFADLEKYANAYARQYKDTKPLVGARIVQEFNTTFRS